MLPYSISPHQGVDAADVYSQEELCIIDAVQRKTKTSDRRFPIESLLAFLPLRVKYQAWDNVTHLKKILQQDYTSMKPWDVTGTHKTLLNFMNSGLRRISFAKSRAHSAAIYVSAGDQVISYLPYPLKATVLYNKPLSVTSILPVPSNTGQQYIAVVFSSCYASFFLGCDETITSVSRLFVKNNDAYVKDADYLLEGFVSDKALPIFVFGLPDMVNHFINLTIWKFNIADTFLTDSDVKTSFITRLLQLWFKKHAPFEIPDETHVPG